MSSARGARFLDGPWDAPRRFPETVEDNFPLLAKLCDYIVSMQARDGEALGRWYQQALVEDGHFRVPSPRTGHPIASGAGILIPGANIGRDAIFYRFPSDPEVLLVATDVGAGYPIKGIYLRASNCLARLGGDEVWSVGQSQLDEIDALLEAPEWRAANPAMSVRIVTGHRNFAHDIWNHFGAIEHLLTSRAGAPIPINAALQPLAPLTQIFPELRDWPITRIPQGELRTLNAPDRAIVKLGGHRVTPTVRARLVELARARETPRVKALKRAVGGRRPVLWLSLRTRNRTAVNQEETLIALCRAVVGRFPTAAILLDGHSSPDAQVGDDAKFLADSRDRAKADEAVAQAIERALAGRWFRPATWKVISAVGLSLLESIDLSASAQFYFCHHGTVQHKIGWIAGCPGVVHSNRRVLEQSPGAWVEAQAPGTPRPIYIPAHYVRDAPPIPGGADGQASDPSNYRIVDVPGVVDFVMRELEKAPM